MISLTCNDYGPDFCFFDAATAAFQPDQMRFGAPTLVVNQKGNNSADLQWLNLA